MWLAKIVFFNQAIPEPVGMASKNRRKDKAKS